MGKLLVGNVSMKFNLHIRIFVLFELLFIFLATVKERSEKVENV